jgi:hypothetical protein
VPVCEVPVPTQWLLRGLREQGVAFVQRQVASLDEALAAKCCASRARICRTRGSTTPAMARAM